MRRGTGGEQSQPSASPGGYDADFDTLQRSIQTLKLNAQKRKGGGADSTPSGPMPSHLDELFMSLLDDPEVRDLYELFLQTAPEHLHKSLEEMILDSGLLRDKLLQNLTRFVR